MSYLYGKLRDSIPLLEYEHAPELLKAKTQNEPLLIVKRELM